MFAVRCWRGVRVQPKAVGKQPMTTTGCLASGPRRKDAGFTGAQCGPVLDTKLGEDHIQDRNSVECGELLQGNPSNVRFPTVSCPTGSVRSVSVEARGAGDVRDRSIRAAPTEFGVCFGAVNDAPQTPWEEIVLFIGATKMRIIRALVFSGFVSLALSLSAPFFFDSDREKALFLTLGVGLGALTIGMGLCLMVSHVFLLNSARRARGESSLILSKHRRPQQNPATVGVAIVNGVFLVAGLAMAIGGAIATNWALSEL